MSLPEEGGSRCLGHHLLSVPALERWLPKCEFLKISNSDNILATLKKKKRENTSLEMKKKMTLLDTTTL